MRRAIPMAIAAIVAGAGAMLVLPADAEARKGGGGVRAGSNVRPAPVVRRAPIVQQATVVRRNFRPRIYAAPIYVRSYGTGCQWLRQRAIDTGSRYWWQRYRRCIGR